MSPEQQAIIQALLAGNPIPKSVPLEMRAGPEMQMDNAFLGDMLSRKAKNAQILDGELSKPQFRNPAERQMNAQMERELNTYYPRRPFDWGAPVQKSSPSIMSPEGYGAYKEGALGAQRTFAPGQGTRVAQNGEGYLGGSDIGGIAKAVDSAGVAGDAQKTKQALMSLMEALDDYERQYREGGGGAVFDQEQRDLLRQRRGVVQMIAKDVFGMGAPQAAEFEMLDRTLGVDPTGIVPNALDAVGFSDLDDRFYSGVDAARDMMTDIAAPKLREYGLSADEIAKIRRQPYSDDMTEEEFRAWLETQK